MESKKIIWSATPTPFRDDGSLDAEGLRRLVEHHFGMGVSGLFVGGTCGEGPFMPNAQRDALFESVKRLSAGRLHVAAQVSDTSAVRVKDNMRRAFDAGADSVVIAPPWSLGVGPEPFLRRYFLDPIESTSLPVGVYVRPPVGAMALTPDFWSELAEHPRVKFVKDSSASAELRERFVAHKRARPDLCVLTGNEFDVVSAVAAGYDGCLMGTAILNARLIRRALDALASGDRAEADRWQERSNELLRQLFRPDISGWMAGLKYALKRVGLFSSEFAHLVYPIDEADRRRIDAALESEKEHLHALS